MAGSRAYSSTHPGAGRHRLGRPGLRYCRDHGPVRVRLAYGRTLHGYPPADLRKNLLGALTRFTAAARAST